MSDGLKNLEHETERARSNVTELLDELRLRVSPGEMVDQIVGYAGDGAGEMVRNLGSQLRNNPLPALLVGVGVAWLMLGDRGPRPGTSAHTTGSAARGRRVFGAVRGAVSSLGDSAEQAATQVGDSGNRAASKASHLTAVAAERADEARQRLGDRARGLAEDAASTATNLYDSAAETAHGAAERARHLVHDAASAGQRAVDSVRHAGESAGEIGQRVAADVGAFLKEQPLVAAGLGLAVGAAIGALLPSTEAENRLMGETSDALKDRARAAAGEQYDGAQSAIKEAAEEAYGTVVGTVASEESGRLVEPTAGEDTTELHARR
jgi:ElaB/YqjD/DUF883 family membrane-anchored ribosome-binding protein